MLGLRARLCPGHAAQDPKQGSRLPGAARQDETPGWIAGAEASGSAWHQPASEQMDELLSPV